MTDVAGNCRRILRRIEDAAIRSGRSPESVRLVAVTKNVSPDRIREAIACGVTNIGENKLQEALPKWGILGARGLTWHFIGHLQTNKAKKVAQMFDWVQSVDRLELAETLAQQVSGRVLPILIEVKLHDQATKSGVPPEHLPLLVPAIKRLPALDLRGFMTIPPPFEDSELVRPYFRTLRDLAVRFKLPELSMGMTHDFEIAVEEGATMVRVGTGIFGERVVQ